jgi:hypothetical protein
MPQSAESSRGSGLDAAVEECGIRSFSAQV